MQEDRKAYAPQQLPQRRPRSLTFPQPGRPAQAWNPFRRSVPQRTLEQLQSPVFAQLSPEVRHIIWSEALGCHVLHIVRAQKRLLAIDCAESISADLETSRHGCWGLTSEMGNTAGYYRHPRTNHPARPTSLLPLLQTCRRIYKETISILYENNTFDINHVDTLAYLRRSILPQRLNQIRVLNFAYYFKYWMHGVRPYDLAMWSKTCDSLSRLAGLEALTMHLTGYDVLPLAGDRKVWDPILQPLMQVKVMKRFEIFLPLSEDMCLQMAK